jgi:hypothetical protein
MRVALVITVCSVVSLGCASMQSQYEVRRNNLSCDQANRYALQSMRSLGYDVTAFEPAAVGRDGVLRGGKSDPASGRSLGHDGVVHITCESTGVRLAAAQDKLVSQDVTFSRGFYLAFTGLADNATTDKVYADAQSGGATEGGVKFKIEPQLALETKLDFGEDLGAGGVLAVKVTVQNGSKITYTLDPSAIELRPRGGPGKVTQMDFGEASRAIAKAATAGLDPGIAGPTPASIEATLRKRALVGGTLPPGGHAEGFVYFPSGSYARARATLVDESGESAGFLVEF